MSAYRTDKLFAVPGFYKYRFCQLRNTLVIVADIPIEVNKDSSKITIGRGPYTYKIKFSVTIEVFSSNRWNVCFLC